MAELSQRIRSVVQPGKTGWEVHFAAQKLRDEGEDVVFLTVGDHDFPAAAEAVEACVDAVRAGHHHYTDLQGIPQLRRAIARIATLSTGVETSPEEVVALPGGQAALYAAIQAATDPGDHALVVGPYYATYPGTFRLSGVDFTVVDAAAEDDFQPQRSALEAALRPDTKLLLVNSPNNPTGAVYTRRTMEELAALCRERDLWLVSDEVYWTHAGEAGHLSPAALPGMAERTFVLNSVSKSHAMTGWRVGWLRAPKEAVARLFGLNLVVTYGLPDFISHAVAQALDHDWGVAQVRETYARRREIARAALAGANGITIRGSQGGMYLMLDVRAVAASGEEFAFALLKAEKVAVMPGESFGAGATGHLRLSLGQPDAVLVEALGRLRRFAASLAMEDAHG